MDKEKIKSNTNEWLPHRGLNMFVPNELENEGEISGRVFLKSLNSHNFRHGEEDPEIIDFLLYKPKNLLPRPCFKVEYKSDLQIDYIEFQSVINGQWEVVMDEALTKY
jgi:hypothetical protein